MKFIKKLGWPNGFMFLLVLLIIIVAEIVFLNGHFHHAIFIGLWAPTLLGIMIYLKLVADGGK